MAFFAFPYHLPCSQFQVFSFLTGNKFVPACWIAPVLLIHSELLHLCVHPSREPDALRVPHPLSWRIHIPNMFLQKCPAGRGIPSLPAALRGLCFTCPGAVVASQPALLLPERKGDLHRGHGEKRKSLTGSILTKMNRNDQADSIRLRSWGFCSHPHSCHSHWFATDRLLGNSIILLLKLDNDIII